MRTLVGLICEKKIQSVLVDCQREIGETLKVKPLTWGHGPNFGSPGIWVVTVTIEEVGIERNVCQGTRSTRFEMDPGSFKLLDVSKRQPIALLFAFFPWATEPLSFLLATLFRPA